ncbi:MAG: DUF4258 domain-containing protein [Anaerolineae bacterium]
MAEHISERSETLPYRKEILGGRTALRVSEHALREAHKEGIRGRDIVYAVLTGEVIERYPERRRALISGPYRHANVEVHVVCDYSDIDEIVVVTVYIPTRRRWSGFRQRRH